MNLKTCKMCFTKYGNHRQHCPTCGCLTLHGININHETMRMITRKIYKSVSSQYPNVSVQK